jgi:hypothetical protein
MDYFEDLILFERENIVENVRENKSIFIVRFCNFLGKIKVQIKIIFILIYGIKIFGLLDIK